MTGIVDVGGGMRGAYGAGIFDWCLDHNVTFDYLIGVSAGSANIASFLAGQKGRNYRFYTEYSFRKQYMSKRNLARKGSYLDLEYIYGDGLSNAGAEYPLDWEAVIHSGKIMKVVATDANTALPIYYDMTDMTQDDYGAIKGSSCVPVINKPYEWKGRKLFDGGLSDPIPFQKAVDEGCDKVVIILTRPKNYWRDSKKDIRSSRLMSGKYPIAAEALANRSVIYNNELRRALALEKEGKALILAPYSIDGMDTLTKDKTRVHRMYCLGLEDAERIPAFLS